MRLLTETFGKIGMQLALLVKKMGEKRYAYLGEPSTTGKFLSIYALEFQCNFVSHQFLVTS